jgi:hypothetical protein
MSKNPSIKRVTPDNLIKILISLMKKRLQTSVTFLIKRKVKDPITRAKAKLIKYKDAT